MSSPLIKGKELPKGSSTHEAKGNNKNRQPQRKVRDASYISMDANGEVTTENELNRKRICYKHMGNFQGPGAETE